MVTSLHVLVYIKRRLGTGRGIPRPDTLSEQSLPQPAGHGFGQSWLFRYAEAHQPLVIWLFSVLRYKNLCLPPSLDARIKVGQVFKRPGLLSTPEYILRLLKYYRYACEPDTPGSFYMPWNNFSSKLSEVIGDKSIPAVESEIQSFNRYSSLMHRFQTPRRLTDRAAAILECFAKKVNSRPKGFVSYRRKEAPVLAMQAAARLFHFGVSPWWDQWTMPRKVAEEHALCSNQSLHYALEKAIQDAKYAITIHTSSYANEKKSPFTRMEFDKIISASQSHNLHHIRLHATDGLLNNISTSKKIIDEALCAAGLMAATCEADQIDSAPDVQLNCAPENQQVRK